jgi:hypothetical protein
MEHKGVRGRLSRRSAFRSPAPPEATVDSAELEVPEHTGALDSALVRHRRALIEKDTCDIRLVGAIGCGK